MSTEWEETLPDRQENELEVLKAIYMDDVKDLRENDAWKVQRPPEIVVSLRPHESMHGATAHVMCDLYVKCSWKYPKQIPELRVDNAKGISKNQVKELEDDLNQLALKLLDEVMIHELCQHVQTFLHAHNRPPAPSFYEEMMKNKKRQEEKQALEEQKKIQMLRKKEEKELQDIEEEMQKRKAEAKKRKEAEEQSDDDIPDMKQSSTHSILKKKTKEKPLESSIGQRRRSVSMSKLGRDDYAHGKTKDITFTTSHQETHVLVGQCLGHSARGSTVYAGMNKDSGELVVVSEWVMRWGNTSKKIDPVMQKEADKYHSQLKSIEEEFHSYLRLEHENLLSYIAFKFSQESGKFIVYLLCEYAGGGHLGQYLKCKTPLAMQVLRQHLIGVLQALQYLHSQSVAHKDLRASSILLDEEGKVRMTDYSISKRLTDLARTVEAGRPGVKFQDFISLPTIGKGAKKGDIFRLGIILLSLAQGKLITDTLPQIPTHFPQVFQDLLHKCLLKDERIRWSAEELLDHSFVKTPLYATFQLRVNTAADTETASKMTAGETIAKEEDTEGDIPFIPCSDQSRLKNEFTILKGLGKGGFGDVIKVKNKLDVRFYAIKRIPLNPQRKNFTRKITREVKLLSRLNHENVVRYYNSWIETSDELVPSDSSSGTGTGTTASPTQGDLKRPNKVSRSNRNSLGLVDDIENFAPAAVSGSLSGWSTSICDTDNGDSFEDDEDDIFGASFMPDMEDDSDDEVLFEGGMAEVSWSTVDNGKGDGLSKKPDQTDSSSAVASPVTVPVKLQFLYIQMEFCEKSTLRSAIDYGLYTDTDRVWRLFREILEGLQHIHDQGVIHRDLKPVNIFLDSNDQVKIGDFGLATIGSMIQQTDRGGLLGDLSAVHGGGGATSFELSKGSDSADGAMTGKVGTALYVSPEMMNSDTRLHYSQKVDMYSLGVMFFEMCYRPLDTGMERVRILSSLRQSEIVFPDDFDQSTLSDQTYILNWLLNHDPSKRPTSRELLQSSQLPSAQMEEAALNESLKSALSNPESRSYRRLLDAIFSQPTLPARDFTYDSDQHKAGFTQKVSVLSEVVMEVLRSVFSKHGAVHVSSPLLLPNLHTYKHTDLCVHFMDHSGGLVSLPYDLRVPFARYVARCHITSLKRYTVDKVYRENRMCSHSHPREMTCCSFDVVSPTTASLVPDAEVLQVVFDIISEFPVLQNRNYHLRINHVCLLKAVLLHCGIAEKLHNEVLVILSDTKTEKQRKSQVQTRLLSLSLSMHTVTQLFNYIEVEQAFGKVASMLRSITKSKGEAGSLAKKALHEMEAIISHGENLGCKLQPTLAIGLLYDVHHFSGVIFQVAREIKKKHRTAQDVLAAGGRYDKLLTEFKRPGTPPISHTVVGALIWYEKVVAAAQESQLQDLSAGVDILVCSLGYKALLKEKLNVLRDLWGAGLAAQLFPDNTQDLEEIQDYCRQNQVSYLVILKDVDSGGKTWLKTFEDNKVSDKKILIAEVAEYIKARRSVIKSDSNESTQSKQTFTNQMTLETGSGTGGGHSTALPSFNLYFIPQDNTKLAKNTKRTYEHQVYTNMSAALQHISPKSKVEVIGLELQSQVLKTIAACLELKDEESDFQNSIGPIVEKHARHRKYLTKIFDYIHELRYEKESCPVILLYGLKDDSYRILL